LKQAGAQQNAEGKGQEAQGQLNDFGSGVANRVSGAVGGAVAGVTGDREAQLKAQEQHDVGKTQQRGAEYGKSSLSRNIISYFRSFPPTYSRHASSRCILSVVPTPVD